MPEANLTITEFLEARIAEDEAVARAASPMPWRYRPDKVNSLTREESVFTGPYGLLATTIASTGPEGDEQSMADAAHIALHDPARVLAECAAKRAIIRSYHSCIAAEDTTKDFGPRLVTSGMVKGLEVAIKLLASVYASHPEYEQGWAL